MIHNSSSDPVLVKKINLKIWSLRDEIEARLLEKAEGNQETAIDIDQFRDQFFKGSNGSGLNNVIPINAALDDSEDAMARAMRGEDVLL